MNYSAIFARSLDNVISIDGKIPWLGQEVYKNDLLNFQTLTTDRIIIMGSKTFEHLPKRKLLTNRTNIVITKRTDIITDVVSQGGLVFPCVEAVHKHLCKNCAADTKEIFVIGGLELYNSMKCMISKIYLTIIPETFETKTNNVLKLVLSEDLENYIQKNTYLMPFINADHQTGNMKYHILSVKLNNEDEQFKLLMHDILNSNNFVGSDKDRTEFGYYAIYGTMLKFDISNGKIPLTTLRSQPFRWIVEELLWFLKGYTDNKILKTKGIKIWDGNTTDIAIKKRKLPYESDIAGPIYGFQWRHWNGKYDEKDPDGIRLMEKINNINPDMAWSFDPMQIKKRTKGGFDQILKIIKDLLDPNSRYSRRHILDGWNVNQLDAMVLPPCHVMYQFHVDSYNNLHCTFYQRSSDVALACSWNASSATILTNIIGQLTNLIPRTITMFIGNAHVYTNHAEKVKKILDRAPYCFPTLELQGIRSFNNSNHPKSELITDEMICGAIDNLSIENFKIKNYFAHPDIKLEMNS